MSIDKIVEMQTIDFPISLDRTQAESLLRYVAEHLSANVHYVVEYHAGWRPEVVGDAPSPSVATVVRDDGSLKLHGSIRRTEGVLAFDSFEMTPDDDYARVSMLRFFTVPDWELHDYRPEVRDLWSATRDVVNEYFSSKQLPGLQVSD